MITLWWLYAGFVVFCLAAGFAAYRYGQRDESMEKIEAPPGRHARTGEFEVVTIKTAGGYANYAIVEPVKTIAVKPPVPGVGRTNTITMEAVNPADYPDIDLWARLKG